MQTILYVDGFNFYFRLLVARPSLKWLNIKMLAETLLRPENKIIAARSITVSEPYCLRGRL